MKAMVVFRADVKTVSQDQSRSNPEKGGGHPLQACTFMANTKLWRSLPTDVIELSETPTRLTHSSPGSVIIVSLHTVFGFSYVPFANQSNIFDQISMAKVFLTPPDEQNTLPSNPFLSLPSIDSNKSAHQLLPTAAQIRPSSQDAILPSSGLRRHCPPIHR